MTSGLLARARTLITRAKREGINLGDIAREIDVSNAWISAFRLGKIPNPGVLTIEKLIRALEVALGNSR